MFYKSNRKEDERKSLRIELIIIAVTIIIVTLPVWLPISLFAVQKYYFTPARKIEMAWDIEIPTEFQQVFHATSDELLRDYSYTVYQTSEVPAFFLKGFYIPEDQSVESSVKACMDALRIPKEWKVPFDKQYFYIQRSTYRNSDNAIVIYLPETKRCVFVEHFSWDGDLGNNVK